MSAFRKLATWLCVAAALLVGVAPSQDLVLCLGPEGTVTIELSAESGGECDCCEAPASHDGHEHAARPARPPCCIDIPIGSTTEDKQARTEESPPQDQLPDGAPCVASPEALPPPSARLGEPPPRPPGLLRLIRSVVLQI